ncbi:MAG: hypothetical protein FWC50_12730 [Planctomycetaceae bacterium]|nr:hypothetical protein [Planctomycetaceae bacterium]
MKNESHSPVELSPEFSAIEASLALLKPHAEVAAQEQTKTLVLLESCRLTQEGQLSLTREKLVETIVKSGEPEITLSLQQYARTIKLSSMLYGLLIGMVVGGLLGIIGMVVLVKQFQPPQPTPTVTPVYLSPELGELLKNQK